MGGFSLKSGGGDNRLESVKIFKTTPCKVGLREMRRSRIIFLPHDVIAALRAQRAPLRAFIFPIESSPVGIII